MIDHCGASLSKHYTANWQLFMAHSKACHYAKPCKLLAKFSPEIARYHMCMPVISPARAATVATHAWTKLHAQIMSWVSGIYECCLLPEAHPSWCTVVRHM